MSDRCFRLPEPPSANRSWRRAGNHMHLSTEAREYKAMVALMGRAQRWTPLSGPIVLAVTWYRGRKSGDLDKRLGVLLDALQGVHYHNDSQIIEIHARRSDETPSDPRVFVVVRPVPRSETSDDASRQVEATL